MLNSVNQVTSNFQNCTFTGLTLKLFIQQTEYVQGLADAAGARILIHNKSSMPFPEDNGFSVSPGSLTYVGLERVCTPIPFIANSGNTKKSK